MVCACERADYQSGDLRQVGSVTFIMNAGAADLLQDCCLTSEGGRFLLKGNDNKAYTLRSLSEALKRAAGRSLKLSRIRVRLQPALPRLGGPAGAALQLLRGLCPGHGTERYAACVRGRPLPPLNTWND